MGWGVVCLSACRDTTSPRSRHPHPEPGTPRDQTPWAEHAGRYGQRAGGTHPTGMQSCLTIVSIIVQNQNVDIEGKWISELLMARKRIRMEWVLNLQYYRGRNVKVWRKLVTWSLVLMDGQDWFKVHSHRTKAKPFCHLLSYLSLSSGVNGSRHGLGANVYLKLAALYVKSECTTQRCKGCSLSAIVTVIYFSQLMGFVAVQCEHKNGFSVNLSGSEAAFAPIKTNPLP